MKFDKFTAEYIGHKITELEVKNFEEYQNKIEYARGRDDAFRQCVRIISDILNPIYYAERRKEI